MDKHCREDGGKEYAEGRWEKGVEGNRGKECGGG